MSADFEGGSLPADWSQNTSASDGGWNHGDASSLSSQGLNIPPHTSFVATNDDVCNCDKSDEDLISDTLDLSAYASVALEFDRYFQGASYSGNTEEMQVRISTDSGATWANVKDLSGVDEWTRESIDLSSYAGNDGVQIAFRYHDGGGWLFGAAIDNVHIYEPLDRDVEMSELDIERYVEPTTNVNVEGTFTNKGGNAINSLDLKWQADGGPVHTENLTGLNLSMFDTYQFSHSDALNVGSTGLQDLKVWVEAPNGSSDMNTSNDSLEQPVVGVANPPLKTVLVEEGTGAWCGWCPDGAVKLEETVEDNPNTLGISVHYGDPMDFADGIEVLGTYVSGYPAGMVDRKLFDGESEVGISRTEWNTRAAQREQKVVPLEVSSDVSYDPNTRMVDIELTADFHAPAKEELRFNAFIVEDHVSDSTDEDYGQVNYLNDQSGHPYYQEGDTIWDYDHRHVLREMLDGPWGSSSAIPSSVNQGDSYSKSYSYSLPAEYKAHDVVVIGLVQRFTSDENDRAILNSVSDSTVAELTSSIEASKQESASLTVYPNPVTERAKLDIRSEQPLEGRLEIRDMSGRVVRMERNVRVPSGASYMPIDMSGEESGMYMLRFVTEEKSFTERFSVVGR